MKIKEIIRRPKIASGGWVVLFLVGFGTIFGQTRIMPIGDSITLGKSPTDTAATAEGYRALLRQMLVAGGFSVQFVGPQGSAENRGYFANKAKIDWFLADTAKGDILQNIAPVLVTHNPNIVLLHIGTNDLGRGIPIGDYTTSGTVMHRLFTLVGTITSHPSVNYLLLCKIIPKFLTPGELAQTAQFNNGIEVLLNGLTAAQRAKVQLVDMYTPFYANQTTYFNLDMDRVHPNTAGYTRMAEIFNQYLRRIFIPSFTDEFARSPRVLNGDNQWVAASGIQIVNNNESGGGAITFRTPTGQPGDPSLRWNKMAVWRTSENLTTVSMKITAANAGMPSNAAGAANVGLAVGLDAHSAMANGYLVWIRHDGYLCIKTIVAGNANDGIDVSVGRQAFPVLQPGDIFKVAYRKASDANYFTVTVISGGQERSVTLSDPARRAGNAATLYAGIMFRAYDTTPYEYYIDNFMAETQLDDNTPPDPPYNLTAGLVAKTTAYLTWIAPGNDGSIGTASAYDLRYSTSPIPDLSTDPNGFARATIVSGLPLPTVSGTAQSFTVTGLTPGTRYYFRMQAIDAWGNKSRLSNEVTIRTADAGFTLDDFNRPPEANGMIGPDWNIDPSQYTLTYNPTLREGELSYQTTGWGRVAIYTGRTNPSIVKLVWSANATKAGISMGGLALMLDSPDIRAANGYLIFIRENQWSPTQVTRMVYLYGIRLGVVDPATKIAETAYTLKGPDGLVRFPQKGDTMTVIMDWFDPRGIKFDVQINGKPATDAPLYDPQKRHNTAVKYAGIMLGKPSLAENNNVTAFYVSSELTSVGALQTLAYPSSGTVGRTLTDSLRILVRDGNNNPLPNTPVWFLVSTPSDARVSAPPPMIDPILIEAEWDLEPKGTYVVKTDKPTASGGKYMVAETGGRGAGELDYTFYVEEEGDYWPWGRVIASGLGRFAVQIEIDGTVYVWNTTYPNYSSAFVWSRIRHQDNTPSAIRLTRGIHTLKVFKLHDNVPIDKFLLTKNAAYQPSGTEHRDILYTNKQGISGTVLTLGKKAGPNRVLARAFGSDVAAEFTVTGLPDVPASVTAENQEQSGPARILLPRPFRLTLKDQYGNPTPGIIVLFELLQGDGTLTATRDTTDANGQALTYLRLGYGRVPNRVRATMVGTTLEPVYFTATATSGLVQTIESLVQKGTEKHYINQTYPNFLRARVTNDFGQPMSDVPVTFVVTQGTATPGRRQPKVTNAQGIAMDTLFLGNRASRVVVEARAASLTKVLVIDSVYNRATFVQRASPEIIAADVEDRISRRTVRVRVWNRYPIEPAPNVQVLCVAKGYGFGFPNKNDSLALFTNNEGYVETLVVPGPIHGKYENIIEAQVTDGFFPIQGSPVKFTIHNESDASRLIRITPDSLVGVVTDVLETPLRVKMVKEPGGGPIVNQPVVFKVEAGGGRFLESEFPEFVDYTNAEGIAEVYYRIGPKTGTPENPYNNIISASATNGVLPLDGSPVLFRISARSSMATAIAADGETRFTGTVGKPLSRKVRVKVMDSHGNGVAGEEVRFSVVRGGGRLDGGADTTKSVLVQNANGIAEVTWILGPKAGKDNNRLEARATNGTTVLSGSPVVFYASGVADTVSSTRSTLQAESPKQSTGEDTCRILVTLMDKYGNPVSGKRVRLSVSGGSRNHVYSPVNPTDAQGRARGFLLSYTAGKKTISATVIDDNKTLKNTAEVIFTASDAAQMRKYTIGTLAGNAGAVFKDSLAVLVTDANNNPVAYVPVTFKVKSGGGQIVGPATVMTDAQGIASARVILGPTPGNNVYEASATGLDGSPLLGSPITFDVMGRLGQPVSMFPASKQVFMAPAGEILEEPFRVAVIDANGDPVAGVPITYTVQQGGGRLETAQPVLTNAWGEAVAYYRADERIGVINLILANASLAGGPFLFEVTSVPGKAYRLLHRSGDGQTGNVNGSINVSVQVTDRFGNPVGGVDVTFRIVSGDAHFSGSPTLTRTSGVDGVAQAPVRLGSSSGPVKIEASGRLLVGSPVVITVYALSSSPANLRRFPDAMGEIIGTKGRELPAPLSVRVEDVYGNPVPGRYVVFAKTGGDGTILSASPVLTDANGVASVRFRAGMEETSTVKALLLDKEVLFTIRQVNNPHFPQLDKSLTPTRAEVFEGDLLNIPLRALPDGDGDPLTFELGNLFPPTGIVIKKQSATTAVLQWTPGYDQQGVYTLHYRVVDGRGGFDRDSVRVTVFDTNRKPKIMATIPSRPDTTFTNGQTVPFWVSAMDPDGDPLHYTWKVDGVTQGVDESLFYLKVDKYFWGYITVVVIVSDGKVAEGDRFTWNVDIMTSVTLSEFVASFDPMTQAVTVSWATSHEVDNRGFEVWRSTRSDGDYRLLTDRLIPSQGGGKYRFVDPEVQVGVVYYYKLVDIDARGNRNENGPIAVLIPKPDKFVLIQNYPNPFNPTTVIRYHVPKEEGVTIAVYNMLGQRVATLADGPHRPGYYAVVWDGRDESGREAATGLYLYRLEAESKTLTRRMVKLK